MTGATVKAVLFDVDGTLVDSNDAHARAWVDAFAEDGITVAFADVRRAIGMGGDKLMPRVSPLTEDSPKGQRVAQRRAELFKARELPTVRALPGARDLVAALKEHGLMVVVATSAKKSEVAPLLERAGVHDLMDAATSSDDAEESKPDPGIVEAALRTAEASAADAIMIGDTPYDIEAATRAGVRVIAFRSGGWKDAELEGAVAIYDGPSDLLAHLERSPLFTPGKQPIPC